MLRSMTTNTRKTAAKKALPAGNAPSLSAEELQAIGAVTGEVVAGTGATAAAAAADGAPSTTVLTIVFSGRVCPMVVPETGQIALLVDAERWMQRAQRDRQALGDLEGLADDHPSVVKAQKIAARGVEHVGRLARIIGSLFTDEADWDWICDMMAGREIKWQQVAEIPTLVLRAYNESQGPGNRAERRATTRRGTRAR